MMSVKGIGKYLSFVLVLLALLSIPVSAQAHKVNVIVDGAGVDIETILENDRTFVPLRFIIEAFNEGITWDGDTKTVSIVTK